MSYEELYGLNRERKCMNLSPLKQKVEDEQRKLKMK